LGRLLLVHIIVGSGLLYWAGIVSGLDKTMQCLMKNLTIASIVLGWCSYIVTYLLGLFISQFKASDRAFWSHIVVPGGFLGHGLILSDEAILCRLMLELLWLWSCDRLYWDRCYISNLGCGLSVY
jgi:hypothetical protein